VQAAITVIGRRRNSKHDRQRINLARADLTGADLGDAILPTVNLTLAILRNADLTGTTLTGADLTGANLTGAAYPEDRLAPEGWERDPGSGRLRRASEDPDDGAI
jgi:hypothetical protein